MNNLLFYDIQNYLDRLNKISKTEDEDLLKEMEDLASRLNFPIVNRSVGRFLYLITKLKKPKLVVEIGSGFGYSAYWFAKALDEGKVILTDYKEEN
ncbi:MAG: O-methyltransferase, partial [Caldisericia bacterium]